MVVKGRYTVQLVDAETKEPFMEHEGPDGKIYVEAEPDVEYYINVDVKFSNKKSPRVISKHFVDGGELDFQHTWHKQKISPYYRGRIEEKDDGEAKNYALRFERFQGTAESASRRDAPAKFGSVSVRFFAAVRKTKKVVAGSFEKDDAPCGSLAKALRSVKGSTSIPTTTSASEFTRGALLDSITLNYCSAEGLIHAGILPKPRLWDHARRQAPFRGSLDPRLAKLEPTFAKAGKVVARDGTEISKGKKFEHFDLTALAESDGEEDSDDEDKEDSDDEDKEDSDDEGEEDSDDEDKEDSDDEGEEDSDDEDKEDSDDEDEDRKPAARKPAARKKSNQEMEIEPELDQESEQENSGGKRKKEQKNEEQNESDEEADDDEDFGMDLRGLLGSGCIPLATKAYQKQVDKFFVNEYHDMPLDLFTNVYRRGRVLDALRMRPDSKGIEKVRRRITKWEKEINKLGKAS